MTLLTASWPFLAVFALSLLGTRAMIALCFRMGILDIPNHRSLHSHPKALMGGVAVCAAFFAMQILYARHTGIAEGSLWYLQCLGIAWLVATLGLIDDVRNLSPKLRFGAQGFFALLSAAILASRSPYQGQWLLIAVFFVLLVIWFVGNINMYNFMDGMDGLAGGCGVLYAVFFGAVLYAVGQDLIARNAFLLCPALLGFLVFNWSPARIFMGDVGSTFLGYYFALLSAVLALLNPWNIAFGIAILLPFLYDTISVFLRRWRAGESVTAAHRKHLYQRLQRSGYSHKRVSLAYYALATLCGGGAFCVALTGVHPTWVLAMVPIYHAIYRFIERRYVTVAF